MKLASKLMLALSAGAALALMSGCGSDGSSSANTANISGQVIDGYWKGAKVCVDVNDDQTCGSDEPSATTSSKGEFTIATTQSYVGTKPLLATAISDTVDVDSDGTETSVATGIYMTTPPEMQGKITPLTHDVYALMKTGETYTQALTTKDLTATELNEDYIATENNELHNEAKKAFKQLETLQDEGKSLEQQGEAVKKDPDPTPTTDGGKLSISAE